MARADGHPVVVCAIPIFFPICIRLLTDKAPEEDEVTKSENQPEAEVTEPLDRVGRTAELPVSFTVIRRFRIWLAVPVEVIRLSAAAMPVVVGVPLVLWWEAASLWTPIHPFPQMVEMG